MNRCLYNNQSFVLTAIYRIFSDLEFSSKNLNRTVLGCSGLISNQNVTASTHNQG
ncbi:hypothetical protein [Nostoc sp.]|uniref:hypothetical protein n=1 Tax=Nostoc sp. TaxID=1180 RepID=UPI002FF86DEF